MASRALVERRTDVGLVVCGVAGHMDEGVWESVQERIRAHGIEPHICTVDDLDHDAFLTALTRSTLYFRTPITDGVASSVLESLALGVPVVACENGTRPQGRAHLYGGQRRRDGGSDAVRHRSSSAGVEALGQGRHAGHVGRRGGGADATMRILYHHRTLGDGAEGIHIAEMVQRRSASSAMRCTYSRSPRPTEPARRSRWFGSCKARSRVPVRSWRRGDQRGRVPRSSARPIAASLRTFSTNVMRERRGAAERGAARASAGGARGELPVRRRHYHEFEPMASATGGGGSRRRALRWPSLRLAVSTPLARKIAAAGTDGRGHAERGRRPTGSIPPCAPARPCGHDLRIRPRGRDRLDRGAARLAWPRRAARRAGRRALRASPDCRRRTGAAGP